MQLDLSEIRNTTRLNLLAKQLVEGFITGIHKSPYHGFSVEFAEHRLYNNGESTRHIDWKVFAKTDKLFTKRYEEETNLRCYLILDNSSSMHYPVHNNGKITYSILLSAALAYLLQKQRDAVGLCTFSDQVEEFTPAKSISTHLNKLFVIFQKLLKEENRNKATHIPRILHEVAERIHKRSLIILFSDMFSNMDDSTKLFSAMQHLKHKNHEVILFHVKDKQTEYDFDFEDRPYEFIDLETKEKMKVNLYEYRDHYKEQIERFYQELKMRCSQFKIDFVEADINEDYQHILNSFLVKRASMS